ncbi:MAG: protoheme IX farnesyltransferase [Chloroflexi bacterium]|nr:protoheme IX farnesyltransferase [Chloroflexota bacterium]
MKDYISLLKLKIVALLVFVALATATVAGGGLPIGERVLLLVVAGGLASAGATVLNHYLDRDIDGVMDRTRRRPLPSGRVGYPRRVLGLGVLLIALSLPFSLRLNLYVAFYTLAGAFVYVVVYTLWLKRRTKWNIVVGGLAGSCAALAGWYAVSNQLSLLAILLAAIVFLWTPSHFWSFALVHRQDYERANIPMLPVVVGEKKTAWSIMVCTTLFFVASLLLYYYRFFDHIYLVASLLLGALFLLGNLQLCCNTTKSIAWRNYKYSGVYLMGLFLAIFLDLAI